MHDIAEYGVAAHAIYKDATALNGHAALAKTPVEFNKDSGPYVWLRRLVETLLEGSNPEEFLEHTKLELFQDQVFCFTPKGRLIALPRGATPLDFAYAVHTDVGNAAVGAFVNGRHVPIDTQLRNGDEVEIETAKNHTPPAAWENLVVTGRARSAIRRAARDAVRKQYSELGRRLIASHFERLGEELTDDKLKKALPRLSYKSLEDALAAVGRNELAIDNVLRAVIPEAVDQEKKPAYRRTRRFGRARGQDGWFNIDRVMSLKFRGETGPKGAQRQRPRHPRRQGRPAGHFRAGRRRAGRPHRRRHDPRRGHPHLPDPFAPPAGSTSTRAGSTSPGTSIPIPPSVFRRASVSQPSMSPELWPRLPKL